MKNELTNDILKVLYTEDQIRERVRELGAALCERFAGQQPLFVGILKGSLMFLADLIRACPLRCDLEMMAVSSYENSTSSSGRVRINYDLQQDIRGRDLIIVEDILDSGNTLAFLREYLNAKGAASITIVTLLDTAGQTFRTAKGRHRRLRRLHRPGRVRRGLRPRLRAALPQSSLYRYSQTGGLPETGPNLT